MRGSPPARFFSHATSDDSRHLIFCLCPRLSEFAIGRYVTLSRFRDVTLLRFSAIVQGAASFRLCSYNPGAAAFCVTAFGSRRAAWRCWEQHASGLLLPLFLAIWTIAVVNDFRLVDRVSMRVGGVEAGLFALGARDVFDFSAGPANGVVVIVVPVDLVIGDCSSRSNLAQQACGGQGVNDVVDGLDGNRADPLDDALTQFFDAGMSTLLSGAQQGEARLGDAQTRTAQRARIVRHHSCDSLSIGCTV